MLTTLLLETLSQAALDEIEHLRLVIQSAHEALVATWRMHTGSAPGRRSGIKITR
jgi:hypothetical protein